MKTISVKEALWAGDYMVDIIFNDHKKKRVDFGVFLNSHSHPQYNKYKQPAQFKKFKIENGNLVWGKDWDMIFPVYDLYLGRVK